GQRSRTRRGPRARARRLREMLVAASSEEPLRVAPDRRRQALALVAREALEHAPPEIFGAGAVVRRGDVAARRDRFAALRVRLAVARAARAVRGWRGLPFVRFGVTRPAGPRLLEQPLRLVAELHAALAVAGREFPRRFTHHAAGPPEPLCDLLRQRR